MDNTGNIKFTHEEEHNRTMSFLDLNIHHKEDGVKKSLFTENSLTRTSTSSGHQNIPQHTITQSSEHSINRPTTSRKIKTDRKRKDT